MHRVRMLLLASSLVMAACGGGAVLSSTNEKPASLAAGSVQPSSGVNAGSDLGNSDVNRVNLSVKKGGAGSPQPPTPAQPQTGTPAGPAAVVIMDRCSTGFGSGSGAAGSGLAPQGGKQPPQPMCAPQ